MSDLADALSTARDEKQALQSELHNVQEELRDLRTREETRLTALQQRIGHLESEREAAHRRVEILESSLRDAAARQAGTASRVETLEGRLEQAHREHRAALQQALVREQRQNRRLNLAMGVAGAALVLGTLAGVVKLWDVRDRAEMLAGLRSDIRDIKLVLEQRLASARASAGQVAVPGPADAEPAASGAGDRDATAAMPGRSDTTAGIASPAYTFHPHNRFRSKPDMQAFFEDNAREEGVISLASGLQYRVLARGAGSSPLPSDRVVFDYRAFLPDGTELYNSYDEPQPATFRIGQVSPGLQEALQRMEEGAQWELYIPPALAYRGGTRNRRAYGFEPLIYIVELKSVIQGGETGNED